jgi:hypothetical protein
MRPSKRAANWCQVELPTRVESTHPLIVGPDIRCWQRVNVGKSTCSRLTDVVTRMLVKATVGHAAGLRQRHGGVRVA